MNRFITILLAGFAFCSCASQKNTKLYGYSQAVFGGAAKTRDVVDGLTKNDVPPPARPKNNFNFFIYLETSATDIQVQEVWVKQKAYAPKEVVVVASPVVLRHEVNAMQPDTLVHPTSRKVLQVTLGQPLEPTVPAPEQKKIAGNELVVRCVVNGKHRYYALPSIKNLRPVALQ